jgi:hypothetical protein
MRSHFFLKVYEHNLRAMMHQRFMGAACNPSVVMLVTPVVMIP